jgi:hypothetical protein
MSPLVETERIVEHLPGEPLRRRAAAPIFVVYIALQVVWILALGAASLAVLPLFLLGLLRWGWPPHQSRPGLVLARLARAAVVSVPAPGLPPLSRLWILLRLVDKLAATPLRGLAWHLDELFFGRRLDAVSVAEPVFLLSAARSGSTQLGHYLEEDPELVAPVLLQIAFPYLWLWHLVVPTLGRLVDKEAVAQRLDAALPLEMRQRHEGHPFRTDTFEVLWMMHGVLLLSAFLGPGPLQEDLSLVGGSPSTSTAWERDFVGFLDRVARKALLFAGPLPDGRTPRLFAKGHFLAARHAVAQRFPDARFLTVVRDPVRRMESMVNHLHANAVEEALGAVPWAFITPMILSAEVDYGTVEQEWYSRPGPPRRLALAFSDYVHDLEGTMHRVYRHCLDQDELPPHVPRKHAPRERTSYAVHRTLESLGVDLAQLRDRTAGFAAWGAALSVGAPAPRSEPGEE